MAVYRRRGIQRKRQREVTEASEKLVRARHRARFQYKQLGAALGVHPRTIARWEIGETSPSKEQWSKVIAVLAPYVPQEAIDLAKAAGVSSPIPVTVTVDTRRIDEALLRAADLLDVSPRRVRAALREIVKATTNAGGTLADLARAAEEKPLPSEGDTT